MELEVSGSEVLELTTIELELEVDGVLELVDSVLEDDCIELLELTDDVLWDDSSELVEASTDELDGLGTTEERVEKVATGDVDTDEESSITGDVLLDVVVN